MLTRDSWEERRLPRHVNAVIRSHGSPTEDPRRAASSFSTPYIQVEPSPDAAPSQFKHHPSKLRSCRVCPCCGGLFDPRMGRRDMGMDKCQSSRHELGSL
jgi:hypothetical protein